MNRFSASLFLAALLAPSLAHASELGLLYDKQIGHAQTFGPTIGGTLDQQEAAKPQGFAVRGAYTLAKVAGAEFSLAATYHPEIQAPFVQDLYPNPPQQFGNYRVSYAALGAQFDWTWLVNVHTALETRRETLKTDAGGLTSGTTSLTRPWASVGFGYELPLPAVHPFLRLEAAYALTHDKLGAT